MRISKKIRSSISKLLVITMLLPFLNGALSVTPMAYAEEGPRQLSAEEAYITSVMLKVDGVEITSENANQDPIGQNSKVDLTINWELANSTNIKTGDYLEVDFPVQYFFGLAGYEGGPLVYDGETLGDYRFSDDGKLRLTFNETKKLNVKGTVTISGLKFTIPSSESNPVQIVFPVSGSAITYVKFQPDNVSQTLTKKGEADRNLNASAIDWVVDVNKKLEHITNAVVEDSIPDNLTLDGTSLQVFKLDIGLDGKAVVTGSAITSIINTGSDGKLRVELGEIEGAYRILYKTTIDPAGISTASFTNEAKFSGAKSNIPEGLIEKVSSTVSTPRGAVLDKAGNPDQPYNTSAITWTVYVNLSEIPINKAVIKDTLPAGLALPMDVKITPVKYDGTQWIDDGGALSSGYTADFSQNPLKVTFDSPINRAYKLEYTTYITDRDVTKFENSADIYDTDESKPLNQNPAKAAVNVQRGIYLYKSGADYIDYNSKYIDWTIDINTREEHINNPVLKDVIGDGLGAPYNFEIHKLRIAADGTPTITGGDLSGSFPKTTETNGYSINFGTSISEAYRITYRTDIENVNLSSYINKATLEGTTDKGTGIGVGDGVKDNNGKNVVKTPTIKNTVGKASTGIDYANKTISWRITINPKKEPMKELKITDTFQTVLSSSSDKTVNGGLELVTGSVIVKRGSTPLTKGTDYTLSANPDWKSGFIIDFITDVEGAVYTIEYTTKFDREWSEQNGWILKQYVNTAKSQWTEASTTGTKKAPDAVARRDITATPAHNGVKDGTAYLNGSGRTEREIDWMVDVNYLSEELMDFTVTDNNWNTSQLKLKTGTLKIYKTTINSAGKITAAATPVDPAAEGITITQGDDGFVIQFGKVTSPYRITYTTVLVGQSQKSYTNTAVVTGKRSGSGTQVTDTLIKRVDFPENKADIFLTKAGTQRGGNKPYIDWTIKFNTSLSLIKDAVMTDTLSAGHNFVVGSIKVEKLVPGSTAYSEVASGDTTYSVSITENPDTKIQSFTLEFKSDINTEYRITYATKVAGNVADGSSLGNKAEFTGNGITTTNDNQDKSITVQKISSGGTATGEIGEFTITKVDASDSTRKLQGAKFQLLKANGDLVYDSLVTGEDGTVTVLINRGGITSGNYYLKEVSAPSGYQLPDSDIQANWTPVTLDISKFNAVTITNQKLRKIQIIKKNAAGTVLLEGAEFKVTGPGIAGVIYRTDEDGEILIDNLVFGDYTIEEVTPPDGYQLAELNKTTVTLRTDSPEITEVPVLNQKLREIQIMKQDAGTGAPLSGAVFKIKDSKGNVVATITTDENGTASADNLKFDTYTVTEVKAPVGYIPGAPVTVKVDNTKMVFEITVKNAEVTASPSAEPSKEPTPTPTSPTPVEPTNTPVTPTPVEPTNTPATPTPVAPTNTPVTPTPAEPSKVPVSPTPEPTKAPSGTPTPTPSVKPTVTPVVTPTPETIVEVTPENTPKGGKVPVPEGGTSSPGREPDNGKVTVDENGNWVYTPDSDFTGKDEFTVVVTHPDGSEEEILIQIDVDEIPLGNVTGGSGENDKDVHIPKTGEDTPAGVLPVVIAGMIAAGIVVAGRKKKESGK